MDDGRGLIVRKAEPRWEPLADNGIPQHIEVDGRCGVGLGVEGERVVRVADQAGAQCLTESDSSTNLTPHVGGPIGVGERATDEPDAQHLASGGIEVHRKEVDAADRHRALDGVPCFGGQPAVGGLCVGLMDHSTTVSATG